MKNRRIDLSNVIYVIILLTLFIVAVSSCSSYKYKRAKKDLINPAPKYSSTKRDSVWNGLVIEDYESEIGNFNYLEDAIEVFGKESQ